MRAWNHMLLQMPIVFTGSPSREMSRLLGKSDGGSPAIPKESQRRLGTSSGIPAPAG